MSLVPPSAFLSQPIKDADPLQAELSTTKKLLIQSQKEKEELNQLLTKLQQSHKDADKNHELTPAIPHFCSAPTDSRYLQDLIQRQVTEIQQLKHDAQKASLAQSAAVLSLEKQLVVEKEAHKSDVTNFDASMSLKDASYSQEIESLRREYTTEVTQLRHKLVSLQQELCTSETDRHAQIDELQEKLSKVTNESSDRITTLENQLGLETQQCESLRDQIDKLQSYIGTVDIDLPRSVCRQEMNTLRTRLEREKKQNENLTSTLEMTNIRLQSLLEIKLIQEAQISQANMKDMDNPKIEQLLLTKWREKVFALLVQLKSSDISYTNCQNKWKQKVNGLEDELNKVKSEACIISHSLSDVTAQLHMHKSDNQALQHDVTNAQQVALQLDDKLIDTENSLQNIAMFVQRYVELFDERFNQLDTMDKMLKSHAQRISFASSRVSVCQAQFTRKEALLKMNQEEVTVSSVVDVGGPAAPDETHKPLLEDELRLVVEERDRLSEQVKSDWSLLQERINRATKQCREEERCKVEDARREQAKSVLQLRQLERKIARDVENSAIRERDKSQAHEKQLTQLKQNLHDLQLQYSIAMETLRQEGLLATEMAKRPRPVDNAHSISSCDDIAYTKTTGDINSHGFLMENDEIESETDDVVLLRDNDEQTIDIISDLKSLSSAVLNDDFDF